MKLQTCLTHLTVLRLQCRLRSLCFGLLLLTIINYLTKRAESSQSVFKRYHDKSLRDYSRAVNVYNKLIMQWWCLKEALCASCAGSRGSFRLTCCSCYPPLLSSLWLGSDPLLEYYRARHVHRVLIWLNTIHLGLPFEQKHNIIWHNADLRVDWRWSTYRRGNPAGSQQLTLSFTAAQVHHSTVN